MHVDIPLVVGKGQYYMLQIIESSEDITLSNDLEKWLGVAGKLRSK